MRPSTIEQLKEGLVKNLRLDFFEDEEITSILNDIYSFDIRIRQKILSLCFNLSNASSSLVKGTLRKIKGASRILSFVELEQWLKVAFDLLDSQGIDPFLSFIAKVEEEELRRFRKKEGVFLKDISLILQKYLYGISGMSLEIRPNQFPYTDLKIIYLPSKINIFKETENNFLLFKIIVAHLWSQINIGTLRPELETSVRTLIGKISDFDISHLFERFENKRLALDIYNILEAFRCNNFLKKELPGLMRDGEGIKMLLYQERPELSLLSEKTAFVEGLYQYFLKKDTKGDFPFLKDYFNKLSFTTLEENINNLFNLYEISKGLSGDYEERKPFFGDILPERVSHTLKTKRSEKRKKIESFITKLINIQDFETKEKPFLKDIKCERPDPKKNYLLIKGRIIELDKETKSLIEEKELLGGILVKGSDIGGGCSITLLDLLEEEELKGAAGGIKYDEWDFRRGDYKRNWCSLYEVEVHQDHDSFVEQTLRRYSGYVSILKKKFELLKKEPRILKRQKDGDDIDIDASVEMFSDIKAGIIPSENIYTWFNREERNIAVLFLVDMSGSTKGWVNEAEKEALVLLCEALESLGDKYAIYGFSGMTRMRCDFYKIKGFNEFYSTIIKRRISGISPKDYTRMGVAIRHSMKILKSVDARTKLLLTISDGKPEDWDAYKGEYGIEDTRKALIETKENGIYPFCITIDKEAQSYLPYMFSGNYIFIDDVKKLPLRITEIYKRLTK
jgi:nitric oxide reductase NorD protein